MERPNKKKTRGTKKPYDWIYKESTFEIWGTWSLVVVGFIHCYLKHGYIKIEKRKQEKTTWFSLRNFFQNFSFQNFSFRNVKQLVDHFLKLKFNVWFLLLSQRLVNFGQIQKIRFVDVMIRSYSFGHLDFDQVNNPPLSLFASLLFDKG